MPAKPPTPSPVIAIRLVHGMDATTGLGSTHRVSYSGGPPSTSDLSLLAAQAAAAWGTNLASQMSANGNLEQVVCTDLANPSTPAGASVASTSGTRTGQIPTLAAAAVISEHIARAYRGARPKLFLPFGVETDTVSANQWSSGFISSLETDWLAYVSAVLAATAGSTHLVAPVGVSYYHGFTVITSGTTGRARNVPTLRTTPLVTPVTGIQVQQRIGSQRRRLSAV